MSAVATRSIDRQHAVDFCDPIEQRTRRPGHGSEDVSEAVCLVVGVSGIGERLVGADANYHGRNPRRHHEGNGDHLRP